MSMLPPRELHTKCPQCRSAMPATERFCASCGLDREAYLAAEAFSAPALASARRWILGVALLMSFGTLILYFQLGEIAEELAALGMESQRLILVAPAAAVTLCFFGLWLWARQQPFAAAVVALALFVTLQIIDAILDPTTLLQGVLLKVLIIAVLAGAVHAGLKAQRIRAEYGRQNPPAPI